METNETTPAYDIMPEPARPQFLTVLCILTWVCCGIMFLSTLYTIFNKPSPEDMAAQVEKMREINEQAAEQMEAAFENQDNTSMMMSNVLGLVAMIVTTLGTIMMWQLKKKGFYVYIAGELIPYLGFLFTGTAAFEAMATMMHMSASAMMGMAIGVMALFDGIFIAMYGANVKHMKN
jgi:uncharacterized Tic20 family protein